MKKCEHCKKTKLKGQQRRFCSAKCRRAWHYHNEPSTRAYYLDYSEKLWQRVRDEQAPDWPTAHFSLMEARILRPLVEQGLAQYEPVALTYVGRDGKQHRYKPDAVLASGVAVELKTELRQSDRDKYLAVKRDNPRVKLRLVLMWPNGRVGRGADAPTQAQWCEMNGFEWAHNHIPEAWLTERPHVASVAALAKAPAVHHDESLAPLRHDGGRVRNVMMKAGRRTYECRRRKVFALRRHGCCR